jgi:hypothetical protein
MRKFVSTIAIATVVIALSASAATAQSAWVSPSGNDANQNAKPPCDPQYPCLTLAIAAIFVASGGTVGCLSNGEYGGLGTPNGLNPPPPFSSR